MSKELYNQYKEEFKLSYISKLETKINILNNEINELIENFGSDIKQYDTLTQNIETNENMYNVEKAKIETEYEEQNNNIKLEIEATKNEKSILNKMGKRTVKQQEQFEKLSKKERNEKEEKKYNKLKNKRNETQEDRFTYLKSLKTIPSTTINKDIKNKLSLLMDTIQNYKKEKKVLDKKTAWKTAKTKIEKLKKKLRIIQEELDYETYNYGKDCTYCYYCTRYGYSDICDKCGENLKEGDYYKHYKLFEQPLSVNNFLMDKFSKEVSTFKKASVKRQEKDRMEMAMVLNSIEHISKLQGDKTHRFEIQSGEGNNRKITAFYKRSIGEKITCQEVKTNWLELIDYPEADKPKYNYITSIKDAPEDYRQKTTIIEDKNFLKYLEKTKWSEDIVKKDVLLKIGGQLRIGFNMQKKIKDDNKNFNKKSFYDQIQIISRYSEKSILFSEKNKNNWFAKNQDNPLIDLVIKTVKKRFGNRRKTYIKYYINNIQNTLIQGQRFSYWVNLDKYPPRQISSSAPNYVIDNRIIIQSGNKNLNKYGKIIEVIPGNDNDPVNRYIIEIDGEPNTLTVEDKTYIENDIGLASDSSDSGSGSSTNSSVFSDSGSASSSGSDWMTQNSVNTGSSEFRIELEY